MKQLITFLALGLALVGCSLISGEEVARISVDELSNYELIQKDTSLQLEKGEIISFWTESDIEYENDLVLVYRLEVWRDSTKLGFVKLNTLETNPTMMEVKTVLGNKTSWSYTGKMDYYKVEEDGKYKFNVSANSSNNPTLVLNKLVLIFKK